MRNALIGLIGATALLCSSAAMAQSARDIRGPAGVVPLAREPAAKIVRGFDKSDTGMPSYEGVISDAQIEALILYIKTL